jgi:diphosphate-dependent phosphofructokinase
LQTQPNICLISEEVAAKEQTLGEIVDGIADVIAKRAENGENFGVALIPEGLIEFIPEMKKLISELNELLAEGTHTAQAFSHVRKSHRVDWVAEKLSPSSSVVFRSLPEGIANQLTLDRDPHGNVQVSRIETERLLIEMVEAELVERKLEGKFKGSFSSQNHFFGYEGRCAAPSNFDADYCYSLGFNASALIGSGKTGYMSSIRNTTLPADQWIAGGVPITMMMNMERRHGHMKPVIQKALVELDGKPFIYFASKREEWAVKTDFVYPGPIQYFGPTEVCDRVSETLKLEKA